MEGFNNSFPRHGEGWHCLQILPCATSPLKGAGKGSVQLHLGMAWSCCSAVNAERVESLAVLYLSEVQSCPAYPWVPMQCPSPMLWLMRRWVLQ